MSKVSILGIVERLAHPHEDEVANRPAEPMPCEEQLGDDLVRPKVTEQTHTPGFAKRAAHLATDLARDAQSVSTPPHGDAHRLDFEPVLQSQDHLGGRAIVPVVGRHGDELRELEGKRCTPGLSGLLAEPKALRLEAAFAHDLTMNPPSDPVPTRKQHLRALG